MNTMLISPTHGDFVFDAVFKTDHTVEMEVTSHPIQGGASITDHSFFQPEEVSFQFGYSDVMAETGEMNHSINAYTRLREIMEEREPLTLVTRLKRYENMLITQLSVPDEVGQMYGLKGEIRLRQVFIVEAAIVKVQTKITSSKSGTAKKATTSDEDSLEGIKKESDLSVVMGSFGSNPDIDGRDGKASTEWKQTKPSVIETIKAIIKN